MRWCARSTRRTIAGCALDTTDPEPLPNPHPLRDRENVIINPHVAWYSEKAMVGPAGGRAERGAAGAVRRMAGKRGQQGGQGEESRGL